MLPAQPPPHLPGDSSSNEPAPDAPRVVPNDDKPGVTSRTDVNERYSEWAGLALLTVGLIIAMLLGVRWISSVSIYGVLGVPRVEIVGHGITPNFFLTGAKVWGSVRNDGASGEVVIEATLTQPGNRVWVLTHRQHVNAGEVASFQIYFEKASFLNGDMSYSVRAYPAKLLP